MNEKFSVKTKPHLFAYDIVFRAVGVLLLLTLFSIWLVCGLFAKYTTSDSGSDFARVAGAGTVVMREHKVSYSNGVYSLDTDTEVTSNTYSVILPGTEIPKDPYIILTGTNDVSCSLYVEIVVNKVQNDVEYEIDSDNWTKITEGEFTARHGGIVYLYKDIFPPHTSDTIEDIIKDDKIFIKDTLKDKESPDNNSETFSSDLYAYLVQND